MSKNTRNRILLTAVAALLLVTMAVGGTMAFLTSQTKQVENTFTPSTIDVTIDEEGATTAEDGSKEKEFKMVPGNDIAKKPVVTLATGSENAWVFVKVVESDNVDTFLTYSIDSTNWKELEGVEGVYYKENVAAGTSLDVLTDDKVTVISTVTNEQMKALTSDTYPTLTFYAYAVQYANVVDVADAWKLAQTDGSKTVAELTAGT